MLCLCLCSMYCMVYRSLSIIYVCQICDHIFPEFRDVAFEDVALEHNRVDLILCLDDTQYWVMELALSTTTSSNTTSLNSEISCAGYTIMSTTCVSEADCQPLFVLVPCQVSCNTTTTTTTTTTTIIDYQGRYHY